MKRPLLFLFLGSYFLFSHAQEVNQYGLLPKITTSLKLSDNLKWVNSIESRTIIYDNQWTFSHNLIDVSTLLSMKTASNQSLNLGYLARIRDGKIAHRLIQQYNIVNLADGYRLAHRLGIDQEFQQESSPRFRIRYRILYEKPLEGQKIDLLEFYLKLGVESLYNFKVDDLEFRALPFLGYRLSSKDKIEVGVDYRWEELLDGVRTNKNWIRVTWYTNF